MSIGLFGNTKEMGIVDRTIFSLIGLQVQADVSELEEFNMRYLSTLSVIPILKAVQANE